MELKMIKNEKKTLWLLISLIPFVGGIASVIAVSFTLSHYGEDDEERPFNVVPLLVFFVLAAIAGVLTLLSLSDWLKWILVYVLFAAAGVLDVLYLFFELSPARIEKRNARIQAKKDRKTDSEEKR